MSSWKFGDPMTEEMKARRRQTFERNKAEGKHKKSGRPTSPPPRSRPEVAPQRAGGAIAAATRRKVVGFLEKVLLFGGSSGVGWAMRNAKRDVYRTGPDGQPMVDGEGRVIVEGQVRAFTDEQIAEDQLKEWEAHWLAEELTDELVKYPRVRSVILRLVAIEERSSLPLCLAVIALPRMAAHGMIPEDFKKWAYDAHDAARKAHHGAKPEALPEGPQQEIPPAAAA